MSSVSFSVMFDYILICTIIIIHDVFLPEEKLVVLQLNFLSILLSTMHLSPC